MDTLIYAGDGPSNYIPVSKLPLLSKVFRTSNSEEVTSEVSVLVSLSARSFHGGRTA